MNKRDSTISMKVSVKLFIVALIIGFTSFYGCKKDQFAPLNSSNSVSSPKIAQSPNPCGTPLVSNLMAGQNIVAGTVTVYNTQDSLYIVIQTSGNWQMTGSAIYVGTLAGMPQTPQGNPKVGQFPYKKTFNPAATSSVTAISLSGLSSCYIVAVHVDLKEVVNGVVVQTQTGWANGTPMQGNNWAMYMSYCTQSCSGCTYQVQSQTLFAGQTIDVGTVTITNDADSIYVSYHLTGMWYLRQVHIYIGPLSGMPINNANVPIPGQFQINKMFVGHVQNATFSYPLAGLPACYVVAAHAEVYRIDGSDNVVQTETAWGYGNPFQNTTRWGWTIPYCTQSCE